MKIQNICAIPFALVADVVTLGRMGSGSFTHDVFIRDQHEAECEAALEIVRMVVEAKKHEMDKK